MPHWQTTAEFWKNNIKNLSEVIKEASAIHCFIPMQKLESLYDTYPTSPSVYFKLKLTNVINGLYNTGSKTLG